MKINNLVMEGREMQQELWAVITGLQAVDDVRQEIWQDSFLTKEDSPRNIRNTQPDDSSLSFTREESQEALV